MSSASSPVGPWLLPRRAVGRPLVLVRDRRLNDETPLWEDAVLASELERVVVGPARKSVGRWDVEAIGAHE